MAHDQAASGKGHERHVTGDESFEEQIICSLQREGYDFARGQCQKKVHESLRLPPDAAIRELLGAINYLAAAIIGLEEKILIDVKGSFFENNELTVGVYKYLPLDGVNTDYEGIVKKCGDTVEIYYGEFGGHRKPLTVDKWVEFNFIKGTTTIEMSKQIALSIVEEQPLPWDSIVVKCEYIPHDTNINVKCTYGVIPKEA